MNPKVAALYTKYLHHPLEWGVHDCVLWAARCVDAQRGTDFEHRVLEQYDYRTGLQAFRHIRRCGGLGVMASEYLGQLTNFGAVQQGDIILMRRSKIVEILGLAMPNGCVAPGKLGLVTVPYNISMRGWNLCQLPSP